MLVQELYEPYEAVVHLSEEFRHFKANPTI